MDAKDDCFEFGGSLRDSLLNLVPYTLKEEKAVIAAADQAQKGGHGVAHRHGGGRRRSRAIDPAGQIAHPWWMAAIPPDRLVTDTRLKPASSIRALKAAWSGKRRMLSTRY